MLYISSWSLYFALSVACSDAGGACGIMSLPAASLVLIISSSSGEVTIVIRFGRCAIRKFLMNICDIIGLMLLSPASLLSNSIMRSREKTLSPSDLLIEV